MRRKIRFREADSKIHLLGDDSDPFTEAREDEELCYAFATPD